MKNRTLKVLSLLSLISFSACTQNTKVAEDIEVTVPNQEEVTSEPHRYGGWYCPDNLNGFPPVDIKDWGNVPVINGRMPTREETQNGTSLIFVDDAKYPNAKPLNMTMPRLAHFYNQSSNREEIIIVIQAIDVDNDSIVGFRYLNGGNGSARLKEVDFISDNNCNLASSARFVTQSLNISAPREKIEEVLKSVKYSYPKSGEITSSYADDLFGNFYMQNDYNQMHYTEKFILLENELTKQIELKTVCGPFGDDYEAQKNVISKWTQEVKELSEK